jgi:5-methylcytosine-specific restriction endonuclease McrA
MEWLDSGKVARASLPTPARCPPILLAQGREGIGFFEVAMSDVQGFCQWHGCEEMSLLGSDACRKHGRKWDKVRTLAMDATLSYADSLPNPRAYWEEVEGDPKWLRRWWERRPSQPYRYVPHAVRRSVAERHGACPGTAAPVECPLCGAPGEIHWFTPRVRFVGLHVDHVHPLSKGGKSTPENLQLLCPGCNTRKGARVS